jgi:LmbE family N-acetylglucosaminyl deacetylase
MYSKIVVCIMAILAVFAIGPAPTAAAETGAPAVFIVPHQDDEVLIMGSAIQAHLAANRPVYVVLVGDGTKSGVRGILDNHYGISLTTAQFGAARDREFAASAALLGVPENHVIYEHKPEGGITDAVASEVIDGLIARFGPDATYMTTSWLDIHPDHRTLGNVLNNRAVYGKAPNARFYQFQRYWGHAPTPSYGYYATTDWETILKDQINYNTWDPDNGRYSIGMLSVPRDFARLVADPRSKWHMPNNAWKSESDRLAAKAWIEKCYPTPTPYSCFTH